MDISGTWKVRTRAGSYRVRLRFDAADTDGRPGSAIGIRWSARRCRRGNTTALFEGVVLPVREGAFEGLVERGRDHDGVRFVGVERVD